ncbi:MAG: hypothetical protein JWR26_2916 [Pedosphaera sp.]|nr:hypothetical protein [Pedosphaera sp.]
MRIQTFIDRLAEIAKVHPDANVQFKWAEETGNGSMESSADLVEIGDPTDYSGACLIVVTDQDQEKVEQLRVQRAHIRAQQRRELNTHNFE